MTEVVIKNYETNQHLKELEKPSEVSGITIVNSVSGRRWFHKEDTHAQQLENFKEHSASKTLHDFQYGCESKSRGLGSGKAREVKIIQVIKALVGYI